MEKTETQAPMDWRGELRDRASKRFPDRRYDVAPGQLGQDGQPVQGDDLDQSIIEMLDEYGKYKDENERRNRAMLEIYARDPMAAEVLNEMATDGNPFSGLIRMFGMDEVRRAFDNPEVQQSFIDANAEFLKNKAEDDARADERAANWDRSLSDFEAFCAEKGIEGDEARADFFMKGYNFVNDAIESKYPREFWQMIWDAQNYKGDVENARREGEVAARNQRIEQRGRERAAAAKAVPAMGGQGVSQPEARPRQASRYDHVMDMFGLNK